ncbi:hypothetical protein CFC21_069166 [Triticum aestivum]|uniref:FBD domain-containing protein n=2 Tax=Triticum aestivum TaxID=4565 RepID=A0A9R1KQG3_WHEAT|nr:hypothetical protein CFC21_069166 [Triticum aestivum]
MEKGEVVRRTKLGPAAGGGGGRGGGARRPKMGPGGGGADLISALPEDLLLQVLGCLRCARAAARTSILSRRWRGLWTRLPDLVFRGVALRSLQAALASVQAAAGPVGVTLLDMCVPDALLHSVREYDMPPLLHAAAALSPVDLRLAVGEGTQRLYVQVEVPRLPRAISVELQGLDLVFADPRRSWLGFPALETLSLTGCRANLTDLVLRCPRLRVFRLREDHGAHHMNIIIRSSSLQELHVDTRIPFTYRIDIRAPALKRLAMSFSTSDKIIVLVSVLAPMLETVSWRCTYSTVSARFGLWGLSEVRLQTEENNGHGGQLPPHVNVLSLFVAADDSYEFPEEVSLRTEIEKHMVTHFSVLELRVETWGHVFGAFALHILEMDQISTAIQSLKVILLSSEDDEACPQNCPCEEPSNWRSQTISLTNLEKVEIKGFQGEGHEFDFLKLVFRCAPMLKTMSVRLSDEVTASNDDCCKKIHDVFKMYPFVECNVIVDLSPDSSHGGAST